MSKTKTVLVFASITVAGVAAGVAEFHLMTRILYDTPATTRLSWGLVVASPFLLLVAMTWLLRRQWAAATVNFAGVLLVSVYGCTALYRGEPWPVPEPTLYYAVFVAILQLLWVGMLVCSVLILIAIAGALSNRKPNQTCAGKPRLVRQCTLAGCVLVVVLAYLGAARVAWWQGNASEELASGVLFAEMFEFESDIIWARTGKRIAEARAKPTAEAVSELRRWMREGDLDTHYAALMALKNYGADAAPAVPEVVEEFAKTGALPAENFLKDLGPAAKDAVPRLVECLKDDAPEQTWRRGKAAEILGSIGPDASAAIPALTETMNSDPDSNVRDQAARALAKIQPQGRAPARLRDEGDRHGSLRVR